jgi:AbrB family looped-hinge helix DNA binding protein
LKVLGDSKVTRKFQATIPRTVRDLLRLSSGDRLVFVSTHGSVLVKKGKVEVQN